MGPAARLGGRGMFLLLLSLPLCGQSLDQVSLSFAPRLRPWAQGWPADHMVTLPLNYLLVFLLFSEGDPLLSKRYSTFQVFSVHRGMLHVQAAMHFETLKTFLCFGGCLMSKRYSAFQVFSVMRGIPHDPAVKHIASLFCALGTAP